MLNSTIPSWFSCCFCCFIVPSVFLTQNCHNNASLNHNSLDVFLMLSVTHQSFFDRLCSKHKWNVSYLYRCCGLEVSRYRNIYLLHSSKTLASIARQSVVSQNYRMVKYCLVSILQVQYDTQVSQVSREKLADHYVLTDKSRKRMVCLVIITCLYTAVSLC